MRILIVEDDEDGGEILRELFESEGFEVALAATGARAIELARAAPFEAALVDLSLPDVDGGAVVFALRHISPRARLALVTGFSPASLEGDLFRAADRVFVKPADPEHLLAFVRDVTSESARAGVDAHSSPA